MGAAEDLERFSVTNSGELILKGNLDYERRVQHNFLVHVTDGYHVCSFSIFKLFLLYHLYIIYAFYMYVTYNLYI